MDWMLMPLRRYAQFSGRSRRREFWLWVLFVLLATLVLAFVDQALGLGGRSSSYNQRAATGFGASTGFQVQGGLLTGLFMLAILIPNLAVSVRRLHDIDRTGWWLLLPAVPYLIGIALVVGAAVGHAWTILGVAAILSFVGFILAVVLLVFYCLPGTRGPNRFGPDPLGPSTDALAATFN